MQNKIWNIKIADAHLNVVVALLQERPFKEVYRIIESITAQMRAQAEAEKPANANIRPAEAAE